MPDVSFLGLFIVTVVAFLAPLVIGGTNAQGAIGGQGAQRLKDAFRLGNLQITPIGDDLMISGECSPG